jgi:hypothetical protein
MNQASDFVTLYEAGHVGQAYTLASNMSISVIQDWVNESTVFLFDDNSAIFASGPDFREATSEERG